MSCSVCGVGRATYTSKQSLVYTLLNPYDLELLKKAGSESSEKERLEFLACLGESEKHHKIKDEELTNLRIKVTRLNGIEEALKTLQLKVVETKIERDNMVDLHKELSQKLTSKDLELAQISSRIIELSFELEQLQNERSAETLQEEMTSLNEKIVGLEVDVTRFNEETDARAKGFVVVVVDQLTFLI
ncbi:uncharacterized protein HKW66_Vig0182600 [Vigna angularis]|uniref:Uncharacterized protein n=1 Tax=Phaseolus angularis TaxID=3914 RepID=A0A8T0K6I3_PHAAN|nr:uncharacterized protein HKW66_Vig0182600 [Vigna angularis]